MHMPPNQHSVLANVIQSIERDAERVREIESRESASRGRRVSRKHIYIQREGLREK